MTLDWWPLVLVLFAALMHAGWNTIAKRGSDGLVAMALIKVPNMIAAAAVLAFVKGKMSFAVKAGVAVAALVAIALLKTFDAKFWGVVVMGAAVMILFVLPWLDHSPVKSIRYRPGWHKAVYGVFIAVFFIPVFYVIITRLGGRRRSPDAEDSSTGQEVSS